MITDNKVTDFFWMPLYGVPFHFPTCLAESGSRPRMCQLENRSSKTTEAWMESAYMRLDRPKVVISVGAMP